MRRLERLFLIVSPFPPLAWLAASAYLDRFDGWGAWAAGAVLLGPVVLVSLFLGLLGVFLSLRVRSNHLALVAIGGATLLAGSVALFIGGHAIYTTVKSDDHQFDPQPYLDAASQAEQSGQRFRGSVRIGQVSPQLSCQATQALVPAEYGPAYERARFAIPLQITEPGRYRVRLRYSSDLNDRRRDLGKEQILDLAQGRHTLAFDYAFGRMWGYFVKASVSTLQIRVDRYASLRDIHGETGSLLGDNLDKKTFRNVLTETRRLEGLANVYTDTVESLVCPEQLPGPQPPQDGLH